MGHPIQLNLSRDSRTPVYIQIVNQVRALILSGELGAGDQLPAERKLADELGLNRSTVLNAYRALKEEGLIDARVGRGTRVLPPPRGGANAVPGRILPWQQMFRDRSVPSAADTVVRDILEMVQRDDVIPFSHGSPAPELLPMKECIGLIEEVAREVGPQSLMYSPTEGHPPLREALGEWMGRQGAACGGEEVLVLSGSQQGLDLAARVFLSPGDLVVVEDPSFFGGLQAFRGAGARLVGVPVDSDGMRTDILETILERHQPRLIYTLPTFQNPSGASMSPARRHHLLELAAHYSVPILEDDPYLDIRFEGEVLPPLKALDKHGLVLYLSTMSKIMFPGMRIGWLVAPKPVIQRFALVKQNLDLHSNTPGQWMLERFLRRGLFEKHVARVRAAYHRRRDVMLTALAHRTPTGMTWHKPEGGFYIWCRLPDETRRSYLQSQAADEGVSFLPGWHCFAEDPGETHIRLNFAFPSEDQIREGIPRILRAVRRSAPDRRTEESKQVWNQTGSSPVV